jgi:SHS2 domain-containing protein
MAKQWRYTDHPADIGLYAEADSLPELFEALALALARLICSASDIQSNESREVEVEAEDLEALAVDFLGELLTTIQLRRFLVSSIRVSFPLENRISAHLYGEPYDPLRHELSTEVKAVTYHRLSLRNTNGRWVGQVILDL